MIVMNRRQTRGEMGIPVFGASMALVAFLVAPFASFAGVFDCPGDCNGNRDVTVDELVTAVSIALGERVLGDCRRADTNDDGGVTVEEILQAVNAALVGCGAEDVLASGIQFVPDSIEVGGDRSLLLRLGDEMLFNDGSETPVKSLHLPTRRVRPLVHRMGVPTGFAVLGETLYWSESRSGIAPSGCAGPGVVRVVNRTSLVQGSTEALASGDDCGGATGDVVAAPTYVYWVSSTVSPPTYHLQRSPVAGGPAEVLYTTSLSIAGLAADDEHVYWIETTVAPEATGTIWRLAFSGGAPQAVLTGIGPITQSQGGFALGAGWVVAAVPVGVADWNLVRVASEGGPAVVLAALAAPPVGLVVSAAGVIWVDATSLRSVPIEGGPVQVLASGLDSPAAIAPLGDGVVWSETICCAHGQGGSIKRRRSDGVIEVLEDGAEAPGPIATAGDRVFWGEGGPIGLIEGFGHVRIHDVSSGRQRLLAAGSSVPLPILATGGTNAFFVDRFRIKRVDRLGGPPATVVREDFFVDAIAADSERLYWLVSPFSELRSMPIGGGAVTTLAAASSLATLLRVGGDGFVYWGDGLSAIARVPVGGGAAETVVDEIAALSDFFLDGVTVYYSEQDAGRVSRQQVGGAPQFFGFALPFSSILLAGNEASVYWRDQGHLYRRRKADPEQEVIGATSPGPVTPIGGLFADEQAVYWTDVAQGTIRATAP